MTQSYISNAHLQDFLNRPKGDVERLEICLTSTCNLKCPLCIRETHRNYIDDKIKYRSYNEIIDQIDEYNNLKYVTIAGSISEPTLHPKLLDIIEYLISRDIEISLYINGDTHKDKYYRKLGIIFNKAKGNIYFTICGSTQELHEKYRVNSSLERVLRRLDIIQTYSSKGILTWIIFNYNESDYHENKYKFHKYKMECFNTIPIQEHYDLKEEIHLIDNLHNEYTKKINKKDFENIICPALDYKFELINYKGESHPCSLHDMYGIKHCWECSENNSKVLRENNIYHVAEAEDECSEIILRYDS